MPLSSTGPDTKQSIDTHNSMEHRQDGEDLEEAVASPSPSAADDTPIPTTSKVGDDPSKPKSFRRIVGAVAVILIIIVGAAVGVILATKGGDNDNDVGDTSLSKFAADSQSDGSRSFPTLSPSLSPAGDLTSEMDTDTDMSITKGPSSSATLAPNDDSSTTMSTTTTTTMPPTDAVPSLSPNVPPIKTIPPTMMVTNQEAPPQDKEQLEQEDVRPTDVAPSMAPPTPPAKTIPPTMIATNREAPPDYDDDTNLLPPFMVGAPDALPYFPFGDVSISIQHDDSFRGGALAVIQGRTETWQGIAIDLTETLSSLSFTDSTSPMAYHVMITARLTDTATVDRSPFAVQMQETYADGRKEYVQVLGTGALTTTWQVLEGYYSPMAPLDDPPVQLILYAEGVDIGLDFAVADWILQPVATSNVPFDDDALIITATMAEATRHVDLPQPPNPTDMAMRENCPHVDATNLVSWESIFESSSLDPGQDVTLPENTRVLISSSIPTQLGILSIPSTSALIFEDHSNSNLEGGSSIIELVVAGMDVQGQLIAGSETCRYQNRSLRITLYGNRPENSATLPPPHVKGLSISNGGRLELHGKRYYRTWTRLAKRALPGDRDLYLQDDVNWEAGQQVVVITSAVRDTRDWHQNEVRTIVNVDSTTMASSEYTIVTLDAPLEFAHVARLEYQVEVALLSRTIVIQGAAEDSLPTETGLDCPFLNTDNGAPQFAFGNDRVACARTDGYGGHIMIHDGATAFVEGVELKRMGQTNRLGRYPMHFHLLGDGCPGCYIRDSSIHESFYRCVSIHGTNGIEVSENVAFDVIGFCYYLEDGVEEENTLSFNLAAHIHTLGDSPANGGAQHIRAVTESSDLLLPADIAASGFYITNARNRIIGNVAVGGWSGFAFPILTEPIGSYRDALPDFVPSSRLALEIDGNTAHSTAHFWGSAAAFYFGGSLYYLDDGRLEYDAGRGWWVERRPCHEGQTGWECDAFNVVTNSKVFLVANVGIGSWSGRMEIIRYEAHDVGLSLEALAQGFWIDQMFVECRTGEALLLPNQRADYIRGDGFFWYDTSQDHIITDSVFQHCGYRSDEFNQYDTSETRGCDNNVWSGCNSDSTNFGFLTHSDQFNPEIMQATRNITFIEAGRRFAFTETRFESVSGRIQNWIDFDGSVSGFGEPTLIGSGYESAGMWWNIDDDVFLEEQAPLTFIRKNNGPSRGLGHIRLEWDDALHDSVGNDVCFNGRWDIDGMVCPTLGHVKHLGPKYEFDDGLPITAQAEVAGLTGGYGWLLSFDQGSPHTLRISEVELTPGTGLFLAIPYPTSGNPSFSVKAQAAPWCWENCQEMFASVPTMQDVRANTNGNVYSFDESSGILYLRITMFPAYGTRSNLLSYSFGDGGDLESFSRKKVVLPELQWDHFFEISVDCNRTGAYCADPPIASPPVEVCSSPSFEQVSYDSCCDGSMCEHPVFPVVDADLWSN